MQLAHLAVKRSGVPAARRLRGTPHGRVSRLAALACVVTLLGACSGMLRWPDGQHPPPRGPTPATYVVRQGDSLYAIALRYDLAAADLARWNRIGTGDLIFPGQTLRLRAPADMAPATRATPAPAAPVAPSRWLWPANGTLARQAEDRPGLGKGIDIEGKAGDDIVAAAAGRVVYSGGGLIGYGNLIIVKHSERILSAYGYNSELLVKEGEDVAAGQRIARMGIGPERRAMLHFEIRIDGQPSDPLSFLPTR